MSSEVEIADKRTGDRQSSGKTTRSGPVRERTARLSEPRMISAFPSFAGGSDKQIRDQETQEKRRESRRPADGVARIEFANPRPMKIEGRLIDVSPSGFRMAHRYASLAPGQVIAFSHSEASGNARVMWNRILDERVETGFLVVAS